MNRQRLSEILAELDELVPGENAVVRFSQYGGGCDECAIVGNSAGYLRVGIEFIRGGLATPSPSDLSIPVELESVVSPESDIAFDHFVLDEESPSFLLRQKNLGWLGSLVVGLGCLIVVSCAVVGLVTIVTFALH